jgi:hypothetical protein
MKKLKGPNLKMPELKTPAFLSDLYYDLRDRRLLPLVALVIVAIAAVPFLLGGDPEEPYVPASGGGLSALGSEKTSKLTVVEATPGLRDYRKRLSDRSPTNPFKQRYTGLPESAQVQSSTSGSSAESSGGSAPIVTESSTVETTEVTESGGSDGSGGSAAGGGSEGNAPKLEFVIDVQISHGEKIADGSEKLSEWKVRHDVPVLTKLPSEKAPVVTLLGGNFETQGVIFLVSHTVKSISGDFRCASRTEVCELLEVAPGTLLEYVYEPTGVRYAIKVTNSAVIPARQNRAARSSRAAFMLSHPWPAQAP